MKTIRFWTSHYEHDSEFWLDMFRLPADSFSFTFDDKNPEYLIATERIYLKRQLRKEFLRLSDPARLRVFFAFECVFPDMNLFDYAIAHDKTMALGDRICRLPPTAFYHRSVFADLTKPAIPNELSDKTKFCNFIYSNPNAHPRRDGIFRALSQYKKVDSLGPHLNNCGNETSRTATNWRELSIRQKTPYRFSIAAENASYDGYITEKIITSFQAHTVPIYWGDPSCETEFNPKAFINANRFSDDELVDLVRKIDQSDDLWLEMASQPAMTEEQFQKAKRDEQRFGEFSLRIFEQPVSKAKRAPEGTWPDLYGKAFAEKTSFRDFFAAH